MYKNLEQLTLPLIFINQKILFYQSPGANLSINYWHESQIQMKVY